MATDNGQVIRLTNIAQQLGYKVVSIHTAKTGSAYLEIKGEGTIRLSDHCGPNWRAATEDVFNEDDFDRVIAILGNGGFQRMQEVMAAARNKAHVEAELLYPKGMPDRRNLMDAYITPKWQQARTEFMGRPYININNEK